MPRAGTPQPRGPGPPSHPPRMPRCGSGALPGAFITLQQTTVSSQITSRHRGTRGAEPPRPWEGSTGRCPPPPPSSSPWPPRPLCLHPSPAAGFGVQPPPSHLVPGTRRVAPCPGTVPSCPINPGQPQVVGCWCCTGWLASPWGACRGTGRWDRSPAAAPHPKKGTSTGARGTGLTSERPVPLLPLQQ